MSLSFICRYLTQLILVYVPKGVNVEAAMAREKVFYYRRLILNLTVHTIKVGGLYSILYVQKVLTNF